MWRTRRQLWIILIILSAALLLVVFPYWVTHREIPTCFDGKQNQGEGGVDCGSPCALLCKGVAKDLNLLWVNVFSVRPGVYDVVAYIENPNFGIAAPKIPYTAKLLDAEGRVITEQSGETFANPNERFAIFVGNMLTGEKVPVKGIIEVAPGFAWVSTSAKKKVFSVNNKVLVGTDKLPKLNAVLTNHESDLFRNIEIAVIIYDSKGVPIAVSGTKIEKIAANGTEKLYFTWPSPLIYTGETEKCETPVDVVIALDRSGSMSSDGRDPPQPLTEAKQAAAQFIDRLMPNDQAAYVSFATGASNPIDQPLTGDIARLKNAINRTNIGTDGLQYTNIGDAIRRAIDELATFRHVDNARPIIVFLTDGIPTRPEDQNNSANKDYPAVYARQVALEAKSKSIAIYTIGLGDEVNGDFLAQLATSPEYFYEAASGAQLSAIYQQIATAICKKGPSVIEIIPRINMTALPTPP